MSRAVRLILTHAGDQHATAIQAELRRRALPVVRWHTAEFPRFAEAGILATDSNPCLWVTMAGRRVDLGDVAAIWWRRPGRPDVRPASDAADASESMLEDIWQCLGDRFWINPRQAEMAATHKPWQLAVAGRVGLEVPRTLITNDPSAVSAFYDDCRGEVVYKTFEPLARTDERGRRVGVYTTPVQRHELVDRVTAVRWGPCLFQERLQKETEYRVTVIGDRVFTVAITDSATGRPCEGDWRRDLRAVRCEPTTLPPEVQARIVSLLRALDLVFGCVDLILTPDGRLAFLEINSSGQWYWIERMTGLPLVETFADLFVAAQKA